MAHGRVALEEGVLVMTGVSRQVVSVEVEVGWELG